MVHHVLLRISLSTKGAVGGGSMYRPRSWATLTALPSQVHAAVLRFSSFTAMVISTSARALSSSYSLLQGSIRVRAVSSSWVAE